MRTTLAALVAVLVLCSSLHQAQAQDNNQAREDFELVDKIGSRKAYEVFLGTHRQGPYADLARQRLQAMPKAPDSEGRTRPNWGDEIFIPRLMDQQKHR
jgi:hypothetical protein